MNDPEIDYKDRCKMVIEQYVRCMRSKVSNPDQSIEENIEQLEKIDNIFNTNGKIPCSIPAMAVITSIPLIFQTRRKCLIYVVFSKCFAKVPLQ